MYGQELNPESYAICKADMLIKGQDIGNIIFGNTLSQDGLHGKHFDYMLSNPPFGVEWKKIEKEIRKDAEIQGYNGRFGPGLPRVSDGSLLFLLHLLSKIRPALAGAESGPVPDSARGLKGGRSELCEQAVPPARAVSESGPVPDSARGSKELIGRTELEVTISNQCGRLVANIVIAYNSILLSNLLERYQAEGNQKALNLLKRISPTAWQHIHFLGHYTF